MITLQILFRAASQLAKESVLKPNKGNTSLV